jgi:hypothetical protein
MPATKFRTKHKLVYFTPLQPDVNYKKSNYSAVVKSEIFWSLQALYACNDQNIPFLDGMAG